jgi:tRNA nucleotidyltransferase (CCA-adding enzyme)
MNLEERYQQIQLDVLKKIRPAKKERELLKSKYAEISLKLEKTLQEANIQARIELIGSLSRDTWISGNRDIDIFVILPYESNLSPEDLLNEIKKGIKLDWIRKHAKHPYLYAILDDIEIEILPSYEFKPGRKIRSAVDRSPNHKQYIIENLPIGSNEEVRLLKQFMKGTETYGAEIKVHGFSGYLVELLIILNDGKFLNVLKNANQLLNARITFQENLDIDDEKFKDDTFIVIDPTDKNRNVASAVKEQTLANFIAAAQSYLKNPSMHFFFPKHIEITKEKLQIMKDSSINICAIFHKEPKLADDILWGQLRRFENGLYKFLEKNQMEPIKVDSIVSNNEIITLVLTQKQHTPFLQWSNGPPVNNDAQWEFLNKYSRREEIVFGPAIIENRWKVLLSKKPYFLEDLIKNAIKEKAITLPSHLDLKLKSIEIVCKEDLIKRFSENKDRSFFLFKLLLGKPSYLIDE